MGKLLLFVILLIQTHTIQAQKATVLGRVIDYKSQEAMAAVTIALQNTGKTTFTNADGIFVLDRIPDGEHLLTISHPNYVPQTFSLRLLTDDRSTLA